MAKTKLSFFEKKKHEDTVEQMKMYGRACQAWIPNRPLIMKPISRAESRYYKIMELKCEHWCAEKSARVANEAIQRWCRD